jgi:general stress protein 26
MADTADTTRDAQASTTKKLDDVNLAYYNVKSREWVSVAGTAQVTQDRNLIRELYKPDWKAWFGDEGGDRDGGPGDPRLERELRTDAAREAR